MKPKRKVFYPGGIMRRSHHHGVAPSLIQPGHSVRLARLPRMIGHLALMFLLALALAFAGCRDGGGGGGGGGGGASSGPTVDVAFQIQFPGVIQNGITPMVTKDPSAVLSVGVLVTETSSGAVVAAETALTYNAASLLWEGTLTGLPTGISLNFNANAYDGLGLSGNIIYTDLITQTLSEVAPNTIIFNMVAVDLGPGTIPVVNSVAMAATIQTGTTNNNIQISILHSGLVDYTVTVALGLLNGVGQSITGTHDPALGALTVFYDAPASIGAETITIELVDSVTPGGTFTVVYPITLGISASASMMANFGPAITALSFSRTATTLTAIPTIVAPATPLTYAWSGTGDFLSLAGTAATVVIDPFNDAMSGDVTLTVTDANAISATVTHPIAPGDFPYNLVWNSGFDDFLDPFNGPDMNGDHLDNLEMVREVVDDGSGTNFVLKTAIRSQGSSARSRVKFSGAIIPFIQAISADVTVTDSQQPAGETVGARARISGTFFNDGTGVGGSGDYFGDIYAQIGITGDQAFYQVSRCTDSVCNQSTPLAGGEGTLGAVTQGQTYTLTLAYDGAASFTFSAFDVGAGLPLGTSTLDTLLGFNPVGATHKAIESRVFSSSSGGRMTAQWDNVRIDTGGGLALYDDFETGLIDPNLWLELESSVGIVNGAMEVHARDSGVSSRPRTFSIETVSGLNLSRQRIQAGITIQNATMTSAAGLGGSVESLVHLVFQPAANRSSGLVDFFLFSAGLEKLEGEALLRSKFTGFGCVEDVNGLCSWFHVDPIRVESPPLFSLGESVTASVEYDPATHSILFQVGGEAYQHDLTGVAAFNPGDFWKGRMISFATAAGGDPTSEATLVATFDNLEMGQP